MPKFDPTKELEAPVLALYHELEATRAALRHFGPEDRLAGGMAADYRSLRNHEAIMRFMIYMRTGTDPS